MLSIDSQILIGQLELLTLTAMLFTALILLVQDRINSMITTFTCQSGLLVITTILQAIATDHTQLYASATIIFILKVITIPYLLNYTVRKLNIRHKVSAVKYPSLLLMGAGGIIFFCYYLVIPMHKASWFIIDSTVMVAMSVTLLGMLLLITHRKAISHVIGFMAMENGIFLAAITAAHGMPMMVELGIAFDVLVAAVLFGVFFFHIRDSIDSLNVDKLNSLHGDS